MDGRIPQPKELIVRAREMRWNPTSAERRFWSLVCKRRFEGVKFRRQHPHGRYILDFFAMRASVAVEFDGVFHDQRRRRDAQRDEVLMLDGVLTLRFDNDELFFNPDLVLEKVWSAVEFGRGWCDAPPALRAPSPEGGGGTIVTSRF